jgi:hypothetical protein
MLLDGIVARVFDDSLANTEREIEAAVRGIALFKVLHDAQSV